MTTITLQIPNSQVSWFEQMVHTMGWTFKKEETRKQDKAQAITPALRMAIDKARQESANGEVAVCHTPQEMQQYFEALNNNFAL